ncbi:uncharacterized protein [Panulirus ornatus]|uniref:uncharacterized protein isoform X3 n=1 Tax=Panulirus ornatus TaxID=150431 RepID=UPI003A88D114
MTEGSMMGVEREEYVEVLQNYSYQRDDRTLRMTKGEILMLLKRSTSDWWQVIRHGEQRPFFAPAQYIRVTTVPHEQMKLFIRQGRQQQQKPQLQHVLDDIIPTSKPQGIPSQQMESKITTAVPDSQSLTNAISSQSYMAKIDPIRLSSERKDQYPGRLQGLSSFKSDSPRGQASRSSCSELPSPLTNLQGCVQSGQESSSSHTSRSSLNDGSLESLKYIQSRKQVIKAASHDELTSGDRSQSTLDVSQPRAASSEELDGHYGGRDYLFKSNQLSQRHRSNSVDLRIFQRELCFSEMKQGSLDKSRKPRLSKDPGNRRRSWAIEELRASENLRPSLRRGETLDAAIVLDVPPKLPPKQRKHRLDVLNSSSENIGRLEGPIDIKLQEVIQSKSMLPSDTNENDSSKDSEKGHYQQSSDPMTLSESEKKSSLGHLDAKDLKDPPVALPRKILPPQVFLGETKHEDKDDKMKMKVGVSSSLSLSSSLPRDAASSQIKKSSSHSNLDNTFASKDEGILKRGGSLSQGNHKSCNPDNVHRIPGTPESLRKVGGSLTSTKKSCSTPESPRKVHGSSGKMSGIRETLQSFKQKSERKDSGKEEEKTDGGKMPPREMSLSESPHCGKITQNPPSPQAGPQKIMFDDWGEYIDEATRRHYYYNTRTREKRWKPPRKGIHSVAIPEVPLSAKKEELRGNSSHGPPRIPAPDYPSSPKSSHKPFSYSNLLEGASPLLLNRAATLAPASTVSQHQPVGPSHTFPMLGVSPDKNMLPHQSSNHPQVPSLNLITPPLVPPSSAKPHYPATPTSPVPVEFTEFSEADQRSSLLDVLFDVSPPKGWCKRYDALTQRVYFFNRATHQRPKGVSWVTEVDIAYHDDKQYIRKTYQSTMDLAKELQLDADVFSDTCPSPRENTQVSCSTPLQESDHTFQEEIHALNDLSDGSSKVAGHKLSQSIYHDSKVPPKKPPRKSQLSVQSKETEIVTISSRVHSPVIQTRSLLAIPDTPSIMEAGSRVSSFTPHTSTSKPLGHSRSKSESLKVDKVNILETGFQDPSIAVALAGIVTDPKTLSINVAGSQSSTKLATRSKSPSKLTTSHMPLSKYATSPKSPSKHTTSPKSPSKHTTSPKSQTPKSPTFSYSQSPVDDQREKNTDTLNSEVMTKDQYEEMLRELSAHKIMSSRVPLKSVNDKNIEEEGALASNAELRREFTETTASDDGKVEEYLSQKAGQERLFSLSDISMQDTPQEINTPSEEVVSRPLLSFHNKSLAHVRKSTFISQDEVGSILEDKSLSSMIGFTSSFEDNPALGGGVVNLASPHYLTHDIGHGIQSDQDGSSFNGDTENASSTLHSQFVSSGYSRERKRSQGSEKWFATNNDEGKIYYYEENGTKSLWKLPEVEDYDDSSGDGKGDSLSRPTSPPESLRISTLLENLQESSENIVKEGFLHRTFLLRDGKKVRKNWTQSYARYIVGTFNSGSSGLLYFSKTKDEDKKAEMFEFFPICHLEHTPDKKTSRQQVLGLRNGHDTEVLLQFDDKDIAYEWFRVLVDHEGMQFSDPPVTEKEEKKGKRGFEKIKREASVEHLNNDSKGITDKLRNFIKRRPLKETLEKKGIYKESVFGSTLAELSVQDKTTIPIFVLQCINHIEKSEENLRTDGLYRISGNAAQIQKIRFEVAQRNYTILSREKEIHNLSGALKLFFRELKEPLIPFDNYQEFIQATGSEYRRMNQQADKLTKAVNRLPPENCDTLKVLLQHLLRVSEYESENRMSVSNLAIVFGPCLLWPRVTLSHDLMTDVMLHNRVIEGLLTDFSKIFPSKR